MDHESSGKGPVTVINVFRLESRQQAEVVKGIEQLCQRVMNKQDGFVAAAVYRSLDGRRVTVQSQWKGRGLFEAAFRRPEVVNEMRRLLSVAQPEWHLYELVYSTLGK